MSMLLNIFALHVYPIFDDSIRINVNKYYNFIYLILGRFYYSDLASSRLYRLPCQGFKPGDVERKEWTDPLGYGTDI